MVPLLLDLGEHRLSESFIRIQTEMPSRPIEPERDAPAPDVEGVLADHPPGQPDHAQGAEQPKAAEVCTQLVIQPR